MPMVESSTLFERAFVMGVFPVPDEARDLSSRIDQILQILRIQNSLLCQLLPQSAKLTSDLKDLASLERKLDAIDHSLSAIQDFARFK
jgi:hypothetical protein